MPSHDRFRYDGLALDPAASSLTCRYSTGSHRFTERFTFHPTTGHERGAREAAWEDPAVAAAARLLYLLAGVSYYKTSAAPRIDLGDLPTTSAERAFLRRYYTEGLAEFAHRNGLDLREVVLEGPDAVAAPAAHYRPEPGRPLIPFGGGIDSIVTVEGLAPGRPGAALFVVSPPGDRFAAIEDAAAVTGLPVSRATREIDPQVRRSDDLGFLNGHVPVTAVITAAALVAAVLERRDAVVLSNEWSASVPTVVVDGHGVNHQWSKSEEFEQAFGDLVTRALGPHVAVFSWLRPRSELWVARRFAELTGYHGAFRSCNRAFHQDPARRLDHWCGHCDKCCFVDLILAPFMARHDLASVFSGDEPLEDVTNLARFESLLGLTAGAKPFECVGDTDECRAAARLAAARPDRTASAVLGRLCDAMDGAGAGGADEASLLGPRGHHRIPDPYAPADLLVRAR